MSSIMIKVTEDSGKQSWLLCSYFLTADHKNPYKERI
jgi:hypothetical protein